MLPFHWQVASAVQATVVLKPLQEGLQDLVWEFQAQEVEVMQRDCELA